MPTAAAVAARMQVGAPGVPRIKGQRLSQQGRTRPLKDRNEAPVVEVLTTKTTSPSPREMGPQPLPPLRPPFPVPLHYDLTRVSHPAKPVTESRRYHPARLVTRSGPNQLAHPVTRSGRSHPAKPVTRSPVNHLANPVTESGANHPESPATRFSRTKSRRGIPERSAKPAAPRRLQGTRCPTTWPSTSPTA